MRGVTYWVRSTLRRRVRAAVLVAVVLAVGGGCALTAAAGARRSATSLDRFTAAYRSYDGAATADDEQAMRAALALDGIADHQRFFIAGLMPADRPCGFAATDFFPISASDGDPYRLDTPHIVRGRLPDQGRADEITLPASVARRLDASVGDLVRFGRPAGEPDCDGTTVPELEEVFEFHVVGLTRRASEIGAVDADFAVTPLTEAFVANHPDLPDISGPVALVRLEPGADRQALMAAAEDLGAELDFTFNVGPRVAGAVDTIAAGLWVTAAVLAAATSLGLLFALVRQADVAIEDLDVLAALGVERPTRMVAVSALGMLAALVGLVGAVGVSVVLSPLHPIGVARQAEVDPGLHLDAGLTAAGLLVALAVSAALAGLTALRLRFRRTVRPAGAARRRGLAAGIARAGAPPWAVIGASYAAGGGRGDVPGRTAASGVAVGVAGVTAALVLAGSLDATLAEPDRYGWGDFDASVSFELFGERADDPDDVVVRRLLEEPGASVATVFERRELLLDGEVVSGHFLELHGGSPASAGFTLVDGRRPSGPEEIALGQETAADLGVGVGGRVRAAPDAGEPGVPLQVVGLAAFPASEDSLPLASGYVADAAAAEAIGLDLECLEFQECGTSQWVAFGPGVDAGAARAELSREGFQVSAPKPGAEVSRLQEVSRLPGVVTSVLAVLAAAGLLHALAATPSRRRSELGTLAAVGFRRHQLAAVLAIEGLTIASVGALAGLVAGWILGRAGWQLVATDVGVPDRVEAGPLVIVAVAAGALALGIVLSAFPARRVAATVPAAALREER